MTCGHLSGRLKDMIEGAEGQVTLPIPSCLIEHPKGRALFDSGMRPQCRHDAPKRLASLDRLAALEQGGARLIFGHDAEMWNSIAQAPAPAV